MSDDWGIPDWRTKAAYGNSKQWGGFRWRWEFTRRREDYREDSERFLPAAIEHLEAMKSRFPDRKYLNPRQAGFTVGHTVELSKKYGIGGLLDPRIGDQPFYKLVFISSVAKYVPGFGPSRATKFEMGTVENITDESLIHINLAESGGHSDVWIHNADGKLIYESSAVSDTCLASVPDGTGAVVFDLSKPIERQWEQFRETVLWYQEQKFGKVVATRRHPAKWLEYLRILDARADGASWREIAESGLLGNLRRSAANSDQAPQTARQVWEQSRHLMFNWPN